MTRRLSALVMILALSVSTSSPGRAESTGLDLGLLRSGMPLTELRQVSWPAGSRLLCSGDADLPANLVSPPRNGIVPPANLARQGVVLCALFAPDASGAWVPQTVDFAGAPAQIWLLTVAEKKGASPRLVQAKLGQAEDAFKATVDFVAARLGPADFLNTYGARWRTVDSEVIIGHQSTGGISTILTDKRLEAVVREMTGEGKLNDKPKP